MVPHTIVSVETRKTSMTRAKDSDRADTCKVLDSALGEGQLTMEEHRQRVSSATTSATLGELSRLVGDLQNSNAPVQLPTLGNPRANNAPSRGAAWALRLATAAVLVAFGVGIGWGLFGEGNSSAPGTQAGGAGKPDGIAANVLAVPRQQSLDGVTKMFDDMRAKFGNTMAYELDIRKDMAMLYRPDPQDNRRKVTYYYRGGWGDPQGPETLDDDDILIDVAKFDVEKILAVLRGAPQTLDTKPEDVSDSWLRIEASEDPSTPDLANIDVIVSSDFGGGNLTLYPDGTVKELYRSSR